MAAPRHTKFYLDKQNKKWLGVCAGIADYTGLVVPTLLSSGNVVLAYLIAAWLAPSKPREFTEQSPEQTKFWQGVRASPTRTVRDVRSRFRELARRLADVETYITSSTSRLAREIEQLR